jgi:hypothetical protein
MGCKLPPVRKKKSGGRTVKLPEEMHRQISELAKDIEQTYASWVRMTCEDVLAMCDPRKARTVPRVVAMLDAIRNAKSIGPGSGSLVSLSDHYSPSAMNEGSPKGK